MHRAPRQSGRISFVALAGLCSAALVVFLFLFSSQSPQSAATEFMSALANGDAKALAELSVLHDKPKEEIQKKWEDTVVHAKNYLFVWRIAGERHDANSAAVRLDFTKNPISPSAYPEHFELQLVKTGGGWKVDVTQIPREMYPYLPQ